MYDVRYRISRIPHPKRQPMKKPSIAPSVPQTGPLLTALDTAVRQGLSRRSLLLGTGTGLLASLAACGGGDNPLVAPAAPAVPVPPVAPPAPALTGAEAIIAAVQGVSQSAFPARDYSVTAYGAQPCTTVAFTTPYTDLTKSPVSAGADQTQAPGSFDSRPAFLAAIAACNAAGGGRVVVPSGTWYCAGPIVLQSHVDFHLSASGTIYFSNNPQAYAK